jgi:signal transduction histidine kinase
MSVVCLFLFVILTSLYISTKIYYERRSDLILWQTVERALPMRPGTRLSEAQPITVVYANGSDNVTTFINQIHYIEEGDIPRIIAEIDAAGSNSGVIYGSLRFLKRQALLAGRWYALVDAYAETEALRTQALYSWFIGFGAAALFYMASLILSRWIVRPVEAAWERQRRFVADASHELMTPLTVVLSNADMLMTQGAVSGERNAGRLEYIKTESQRMKRLIGDMLTLARSDSGAAKSKYEPVSLSFIVTHAVLTMEPAIFDSGRKIETRISEGWMVMGDAGKLRQLVEILMDNACKYSEKGTAIDVRLTLTGKRDLIFSVKSEGPPIPQDEMNNIFRRFYRTDKSRGEEKGYGLGLAIAESIVSEHKGRIWAQADGVNCNTFYVRLSAIILPQGD